MNKPFFIFLILIQATSLLFFFNRGFTYHDEGYILQAAQRVLSGQVPYRDFYFLYTPVTIYLTALTFKLFGLSILSERILSLALTLGTGIIILLTFTKLRQNYGVLLFAIFSYTAWGPMHVNFIWPVMMALDLGLIAVYCLINGNLLVAGCFTALVFLAKQNIGLGVFLSGVLSLWWLRQKSWKSIRLFIISFLVILAAFGFYLWTQQALLEFIEQVFVNAIKTKVWGHTLSLEFLKYGPWYKVIGKTLFYTLPLTSASITLVVLKRRQKLADLGYLPLFTLGFYLANAWPDIDYIHVGPTLGLAGVNLTLFLAMTQSFAKKFVSLVLSLLILGGITTALFLGYYRWETPLIYTTNFMAYPRLGIYVDGKYAAILPWLIAYTHENSSPSDMVFSYYYAPMFNFITDRTNPTRGLDMTPNSLPSPYEQRILTELVSHPPKLVITHWQIKDWAETAIGRYILTNYEITQEMQDITIWKRKQALTM